MKMLFFSSDWAEVEMLRKEFCAANIPCKIRVRTLAEIRPPNVAEAELWIQNDKDWYRASMLCVQLGLGFAKPAEPPAGFCLNNSMCHSRFDPSGQSGFNAGR